jgi:hypothetical protein
MERRTSQKERRATATRRKFGSLNREVDLLRVTLYSADGRLRRLQGSIQDLEDLILGSTITAAAKCDERLLDKGEWRSGIDKFAASLSPLLACVFRCLMASHKGSAKNGPGEWVSTKTLHEKVRQALTKEKNSDIGNAILRIREKLSLARLDDCCSIESRHGKGYRLKLSNALANLAPAMSDV